MEREFREWVMGLVKEVEMNGYDGIRARTDEIAQVMTDFGMGDYVGLSPISDEACATGISAMIETARLLREE